MDKVIQIANLIQGGKRKNPQRGRIYSAQGCSPCLNGIGGGRRFRTEILMDKAKVTTPPPPDCAMPSDGATTATKTTNTAQADSAPTRTSIPSPRYRCQTADN